MDARFVFEPTISAWNKLSVHYKTPCVKVTSQSSRWIRAVAPIANVGKKALVGLAYAAATLAMGILSVVSLPYRYYQNKKLEREFQQFITSNPDLLPPSEEKELREQIEAYLEKKKNEFTIDSSQKEEVISKIIRYYARSNAIYGPIVTAWTEDLLKQANESGKKLVFMARDGIPPYKIAKKMMADPEYQKKYPNLVGEDKIVLAYISRSVVSTEKKKIETQDPKNPPLFAKYIEGLEIKAGDQIMAVDIGFQGSMIDDIRSMLPGVNVDFHYLISHTERAAGFIYSKGDKRAKEDSQLAKMITSIEWMGAGQNRATHWLEDSHQGAQGSAKTLVEEEGKVYPNTRVPNKKQYASEKGSEDFLLRKWTQKAVVRNWKRHIGANLPVAIKKLDYTLKKIKEKELDLLIKHA
jgi:hypothetical protein